MKIRKGFVTNSSSASFILTIKTKTPKTIDEFKKMFNDFLDTYEQSYYPKKSLQFWNPNYVKQIGDTIFEISDRTFMYNDYSSIPDYMKHLMLMSIIEPDILDELLDVEKLTFINEAD